MPVYEIGLDDGRKLQIEADDQEAALAGVAHFQETSTPSGALAGAKHGVQQIAHGVAETGKMLGIGNGFDNRDPNYVPADPKKPSEWGQVLTENLPAMGTAVVGGKLAKSIVPGKYGKLAALAGAGLAGWLMSAGDTAKERAVNRTGDANAEPDIQDKIIGSGTAAAANAAGAIAPARLVPGVSNVGLPTMLNAAKRYLGTVAAGAGGNAAADAITQAGTTAGTDKGLTVDPSHVGDAAITGGLTSAAAGSLPLAGDTARAVSMAEHTSSPENIAATKAVAERLARAAGGKENLGAAWKGATKDATFNETVKSDITNELGDAARNVRQQVQLSPDADNALQRAQKHEPITAKDVELISKETAGAPDGPNAAFLARQVHMQQLMNEKGSYTKGKWAGGISGAFDANVGYMLNPFRAATGIGATALGMHLLGVSNPAFTGSALGAYGISRSVDSLTGMRSPAATFAQHFADHAAQLRLPTQPGAPAAPAAPAAPPSAPWGPRPAPTTSVPPTGAQPLPGGGAQGPWGPKPLPQNAVPQVSPPAAPAPQPPQMSPIALKMLAQQLKAGLPAEAAQAPEASASPEPTVDPLSLPSSITKKAKNLMGGAKIVQDIREKQQAKDAVASLQSPLVEDAPLDVTQNPMVGKRASQLVSAANALRKYTGADVAEREQAQAEAQTAREEKAATDKVKAAAAKVKAPKPEPKASPEAPAADHVPYEPLPDEHLYPRGITPKEYAMREAAAKGTRSETYMAKAEASERRRQTIASELKANHPQSARAIDWLQRELQRVGVNPKEVARAVRYAQDNVPDDVAKAMEAFK